MTITEPGIYEGIPELDYHNDAVLDRAKFGRSLSASGAKTLLAQPERFAWERDHGRPPKDAFDLGGVVHALVLRSGDERIRVIDAYDYRTKAAQEARRKMRDQGLTPINRAEFLEATKIAGAVRRHPLASAIFSEGRAEVSMFWVDSETGVAVRARMDWLRDNAIVDLKTSRYGSGTEDAFGTEAARYDYPMAAAVYSDGYAHLTGRHLPFVTVTVETSAPYFVRVYQYTDDDLETGRAKFRRALETFAERESSGDWSAPNEIHTLSLPGWYPHTA